MQTTPSPEKVVFHTNGPIDPISWEMMGISAKETDNPIGKFGTGLKYAIAVLLRKGHTMDIHSEGKHYTFQTENVEFRSKNFKRITCNGKPLAFTTEYGLEWENWMAYRELVSNTMDEGGLHFIGEKMDEGTSIVVQGEGIVECINKHNDYFLGDREPIATMGNGTEIYEGQGTVYFKGVKVGSLQHSRYSYNFTRNISLTEDRTLKAPYELEYRVGCAICTECDDEQLMEKFATARNGWETTIHWDYTWSAKMIAVGKRIWKESPTRMNPACLKAFKKQVKDATFEYLEFSNNQKLMLEKALAFLDRAEYSIKAPIKLVRNDEDNVIAYCYKEQIFLTSRAFTEGVYFLIVALFEEGRHVVGYDDYSREFQTYLIKQLVKTKAEALGEIL